MPEAGQQTPKQKRKKSALLERLEYGIYRAIAKRAERASDESLQRWGNRLGALSGKVLRGRDRLAMRNLQASYPEKSARELRATLDECWRHFGRESLMYFKTKALSLEEIEERCPMVNRQIIDDAVAEGRGVLLLSAHFGGWEIGGLLLMSIVKNVRMVARPLDNTLLEADLVKLRARTGAEVVNRRKAARVLMRGLAEKGVIVLLPDQAVQEREGVLVPFLGRNAWTTPAPAKMALHYDATIVFAFCIPDGTRHRLEFESPIRVSDLTGAERDAESLTKRINDVFSSRINSRPELWLWMHDRWKGTGEGERANA
jgi:KDO2-lipid IV(A) lauroyltransferase